MKTQLLIPALLLFILPFISKADDGSQLFRTNCGACHSIGKGKLVGPDLKGVDTRHSQDWILKWVKSSQAMVKAGDKDADELFANNNQIVMPDQSLNDDEIKTILAFIKEGGEKPAATTTKTAENSGTDAVTLATQKAAEDKKQADSLLNTFSFTEYLLMFLMGIFIIIIYVLGMTIKSLSERLHNSVGNTSQA